MDPSNEAIDSQEGEELESAIENYDCIAVFIAKLPGSTIFILLRMLILLNCHLKLFMF